MGIGGAAYYDPPALVEWAASFGLWGPLFLTILVALEVVAAPLPGWFLAVGAGYLYGFWGGFTVVWSGAMIGSACAFWLARHFGRTGLESRLPKGLWRIFDRITTENGFWLLLLVRALPYTALDIWSYAAGLGRMSFLTFLIASGLGFIPGTAALVAAGSEAAQWQQFEYLIYLLLAAVVVNDLVRTLRKRCSRHKESS